MRNSPTGSSFFDLHVDGCWFFFFIIVYIYLEITCIVDYLFLYYFECQGYISSFGMACYNIVFTLTSRVAEHVSHIFGLSKVRLSCKKILHNN